MVKDALRIAELEKLLAERTAELIQQGEELAVINSVQEALVQEMDMQAIYDLVGEKIRELFEAQTVIISTFDAESDTEQFQFMIEDGERFYPESRPIKKLRRHLIDSRQKIVIHTIEEAVEWFGKEVVPGTKYMQSGVFVPLIAGGVVTSYVSLQNVEKEHAFSDSEIRLLETLSNSMSAALQNARLLKETEQRTAELAVINSVQEGLAKELDIQAIYDLVGNRIRDLFNAQVVILATFDHQKAIENIHFLIEKGERYYPIPRPYNIVRRQLLEKKQKILINKNMAEVMGAFGEKHIPGTQMPKSVLFVPMMIGEKVTGYASIQNIDQENAFSDADVRLLETLANTMGVALENARLFDETTRLLKETEQQKAELGVINSVQEGLAKELDMQAIYDLVGDRIRELFNAQAVIIATFDHDSATEHFKYLIEDGQRFYLASRPYDRLRQHLIVNRKKIVISTNYAEAYGKFGLKTLPGTNMTKSGVFVPLIIGDKVNSYISLQNNEIENAFSESDIRLLETLANSMSVALENARLFDETNRLLKETEQRTAELAIINSVQDGLASKLEIQAIYDLVGDKIRDVFDTQGIIISFFDQKTNYITSPYYLLNGQRIFEEGFEFGKGLTSLIIKTGQPLLIHENAVARFNELGMIYAAGESEENTAKSWLGVPLISGGQINGTITLENYEKEFAYSDSDVSLLQTLATSISVALENARLFDETNRLLKETEQRTAELAVINSVQEGLAKELDIQGIYELVGDRVQQLFNAEVVIIASFNYENNTEYFNYRFEDGMRNHTDPRPIGRLRLQLIETRRKIVIHTNEESIEWFGNVAVPGTKPLQSGMFIPLIVGEKVTGYVSLQNTDKEHAFSDSDVRLLETLANSMSVALENARLFDETNRLLKETEQRTAELAVINSVQEGLAKELDMDGIYNLVGDRVQNLFNAQTVIIGSFDVENKTEYFNYFFENGEKFNPEQRPVNKLRQLLIDHKSRIYIATEEQAKNEYGISAIGDTQMPKSLLFVPLLSGNLIKGYVSLQNIDKEYAFNDSDVRLLETLANSMSVALENARLFDETNRLLKETEQRTAELAVINSVQDGLAKELDIQGIYNLVGDRLCELFPDTQTLVIRTFNYETGLEYFKYAIEKGDKLTVPPQPFMWASKSIIENKKPLDIRENYVETAQAHGGKGVTTGRPPMSAVFVPMLVGEVVKGTISLQNVDKENAFSDADLRLLTTLTNSMSVALENARLFDETARLLKETEQRTAELGVINSVQEGLAKEIDMQGIYNLIGDRLCEMFPDSQTLVIRTFHHETGIEHWHYSKEKGERQYVEPRPFNWNSKFLIRTKKPLDIKKDYIEISKQHGGTGVTAGQPPKSALFVPMIVGDLVKGSVSLQNVDSENAFDDSDLRLLTTITSSMSVALENARLFDETTRLLNESKQRAAELSTVNNISKALASQLDTDDLIKMVGDQLKDLFKANIAYLALFDAKTRIIHFKYQFGEEMHSRIIGEGLTSKILMTGEPLLINKDMQVQTIQMGIQRMGIDAASYLGVPIPVGDEIIGVLSVQSTEQENRFDENDLRLLSTIASSVGVALKNATLFEEVKQAKMEAEAASKAAERANDAKSAFLSTVSHELRTPLTSVLGFAKIIRKRLDDRIFPIVDKADPKTVKTISQISENLQVVISEGERLTHLINDVLDLAKIEAGKMEWNQESIYIPEVAERAIAATTSLFDQKALKMIRQIDADLPEITGDKDKLIQVIINLISNAVKFTDKGAVTCRAYREKDELIVSISDTGIGIAPEDYAAVFEQFKQVGGDTLTDKPKGTGLGLPICKEIVEHHGGRIWLESEQGKGSTFLFALPINKKVVSERPLHLDELVKQLKEQVAYSNLNIIGDAANILIVDDDDSIRSLLQQELGDAGYHINQASNGKEALEKVRALRPDLIILDIMMPEMNGFDVAAILKNDPQTMDIPIIVLSVVQDKARGFRVGVDRYLTKPIDTGLLFNEVGSLLEQGKSKRKVMIVDEDTGAVKTLTDVLTTKGYEVTESIESDLFEKAIANQPDIIIINSALSAKQEIVQTLRFEKGLEKVLFVVYQ
jgi:GAF domain-containing protein/CheY-like chemotaxis protein